MHFLFSQISPELSSAVEKSLLMLLDDVTIDLPCNASQLTKFVSKDICQDVPCMVVEDLLQKLNAQALIK